MGKVHAFHGAERKSGVTMLSQSVAEYIAKAFPESEVLFVSLSGRSNIQYLQEKMPSIDSYRSRMESGIPLSKEDLQKTTYLDNLYIISGLQQEAEARFYMPELAQRLLSDLRNEFDVIIADTGSELDNGLAVGCLSTAEKIYLLLSQNEADLRRYELLMPLYRRMQIEFSGIVVNKFLERDPYSRSYLKKRLDMREKELYFVRMASEARRAEMEYRTLLQMENGYARDIEAVAAAIAEASGIESKNEKRKSRWKRFT